MLLIFIFFCILLYVLGDPDCANFATVCKITPSLKVCSHLNQIQIERIHKKYATGVTVARAHADKFRKNEKFLFQIDAHILFTKNW